ncbi:DUF115 domain-containing protein [Shewanella eurypsychrophilus]|uniref:DUF115 domain-containing protein n=1 Tax=Shewanella eurypsychrophilus TaxID=2593656 RepID=A0ABX6V7X2_9GAMM|nr:MULTISPECIES: 6-hydroxymethylpterin diphosphokinase MptE-like protein [Shewanella]QFU23524.1 DUF115 domain-containing protein [Shewanella sp. YLB-09]QPG58750.1 DUF115 domain-containing protein [Shewanella eurypsychrophilus]
MSDLLQQNLDIIYRRWPSLADTLIATSIEALDASIISGLNQTISINGIQLSSRHDRQAEIDLLISTLEPRLDTVNVYGIGMGDIAKQLILLDYLKQIKIVLLNLTVFKLVLTYTDQTDWLSDERCQLVNASANMKLKKPFVSIPSEVVLAADNGASLRNQILVHFQTLYSAKAHQADNTEINQRFSDNRYLIETDPDVSLLFNSYSGSSVFIVGTGPSLSGYLEQLKILQSRDRKSLVIAVDTAMRPLLNAGITPDIVVTMDEIIDEKHLNFSRSENITLVYFPRLNKHVIESWKGPRYIAYTEGVLYDSLRKIKRHSSLFSGGSVIHPALDLAVKMGGKANYLLGCDLAFPNGKTHTGWADGELNMHISGQASHQWVYDNRGKKVITSLSFLSYLESMEEYIASVPDREFININVEGAAIKGCKVVRSLPND